MAAFGLVKSKRQSDYEIETCDVRFTLNDKAKPEMIDVNDKQNGIRLKYSAQTYDENGKILDLRSTEIGFECIETTGTDNIEITSNTVDKFTINFPTIYACPKSCITGNNLCNGHGICGVSSDQGSTCLCDEGYIGDMCESEGQADSGEGGFTAIMVSLIITMLLLAGLLALLIYMFFKLQRLAPIDNEAYSSLSNKFNELGQIT